MQRITDIHNLSSTLLALQKAESESKLKEMQEESEQRLKLMQEAMQAESERKFKEMQEAMKAESEQQLGEMQEALNTQGQMTHAFQAALRMSKAQTDMLRIAFIKQHAAYEALSRKEKTATQNLAFVLKQCEVSGNEERTPEATSKPEATRSEWHC